MDENKTIEILEALASGYSPKSGEVLSNESVLKEIGVIRALQAAIANLKKKSPIISNKANRAKDERYREIDYFRREKFNTLTDSAIDLLKVRIRSFGIFRIENLPESIIKARIFYPRAYEAWSIPEKELLEEAVKFTNDLDILSECFQRGQGSIETVGQKLIFTSQGITSSSEMQ